MEQKEITITYVPKSKKRGFTDRMYAYNVTFVTVIVALSFVLMFISTKCQVDTSPLSVIVPSAFAELGIHTAFVVWKAKFENARKYPGVVMEAEMPPPILGQESEK